MEILARFGHLARYLAGAAVAGAVFLMQSLVVVIPYALVTLLAHGVLGGLLGLLFGLVISFFLGLAAVTVIVFPAILFGELVARRTHWAAAPLCALAMLVTLAALASFALSPGSFTAEWVAAKVVAALRGLRTFLSARRKPDSALSRT